MLTKCASFTLGSTRPVAGPSKCIERALTASCRSLMTHAEPPSPCRIWQPYCGPPTKESPMPARTLLLTVLVSSIVSSTVAFAVARLSTPPAANAEPTRQEAVPLLRVQAIEIVDSARTVRAFLGTKEDGRIVDLELRNLAGQPQ